LQLVALEAYTLGGLADVGAQVGEEILAVDPANPAVAILAGDRDLVSPASLGAPSTTGRSISGGSGGYEIYSG
jgi:hypothetical protein